MSNFKLTRSKLEEFEAGTSYYCGWLKGYISIDIEDNEITVLWTSHKNTHYSIYGNAIAVKYKKYAYGTVFMSAITMHIVYDEIEKQKCIEKIENKIQNAFKRNIKFLKFLTVPINPINY